MKDDPQKFLSLTLTHNNTAKDHTEVLKYYLETKLDNLDKCSVRGEYKIATYERYLLPSLRYHLTINTIHQTHLESLDMIAQRY